MKENCYHGTNKSSWENIQKDNQFKFEKRFNHWLGQGIYFFPNDFERAKYWANLSEGKKVVLELLIEMSDNELLNLDTKADLEKLNLFAENHDEIFFKLFEDEGIESGHGELDEKTYHCILIDSFLEEFKEYRAVSRTFPSPKSIKPGASRFLPQERQLNIVDNSLIDISKINVHNV